jgi:two-component system sensor histidine kinase FlrB
LEVSTRSGRRLSVSTSSLGEEGQIILLTDQTETRKLQDQLSRNERLSAMGKMVSALAHQIRTPLSAAILYAGHLNDPDLDNERRVKFSEKCLSRLQHMERQIRDMLLFVKSELPLNDSISVIGFEKELRAAVDVLVAQNRVTVRWFNHCEYAILKCHKDALVSATTNLVNNAVQSSTDKVQIDVKFAHSENQCIEIAVKDNGSGMNAETLEKVQELFTTTKSHGTGLGLAVVRAVTRAHGGRFVLESHENIGTTAKLIIPVIASEHCQSEKHTFEV